MEVIPRTFTWENWNFRNGQGGDQTQGWALLLARTLVPPLLTVLLNRFRYPFHGENGRTRFKAVKRISWALALVSPKGLSRFE